ncbi:MAG: Dicarboxylate carrier MatC domain protein, partial [Massilibacillus sp.]|nr:Dicarboxylate carrier MatC domain protein [Massilibacillus sp.]
IVGGIMSFFSSTLGVVCPALFPIIPSIVETTGLNPMLLFTCVVIGAQATAISPFSSGGSLVLGSCNKEEDRDTLFSQLLLHAVPTCLIAATITSILLFFII